MPVQSNVQQVTLATISDDNGTRRVYVVPVYVPIEEAPALLADYDPSNQYSPPAAESRSLARVVLDALSASVNP